MGTWINFKECPPTFDGEYLVCDMNKVCPKFTIRVTRYRKGDVFWDAVWESKVTHWMNLPELPKEG